MSRKHRAHTRIAASQPAVQFSVGWYTEQEWAKVRAAAVDPELFEATYAQWVEMAEQSLTQMHAQRLNAEKSYVIADKLLAWCLARGKPNNSASRAEFVSQQARSQDEPGV
jgi:hypothetical protein